MVKEFEARIKEIIRRTYNVKSFRLETDEPNGFNAGQFLFITLKTQNQLSRYLSISNSPTEKGYIEFTKKITDSDFSQTLDKLKPGDRLIIKYPFGKFTFDGKSPKLAFLSGGIGITPIRSLIKYIIDKKMDTDLVLFYGNRTSKDIAFKEDFDIMSRQYSKLKVVHILSEAEKEWNGKKGHIDKELIKQEMPDYTERKFYLCGPPLMVDSMLKILLDELSSPQENIITEKFSGY